MHLSGRRRKRRLTLLTQGSEEQQRAAGNGALVAADAFDIHHPASVSVANVAPIFVSITVAAGFAVLVARLSFHTHAIFNIFRILRFARALGKEKVNLMNMIPILNN